MEVLATWLLKGTVPSLSVKRLVLFIVFKIVHTFLENLSLPTKNLTGNFNALILIWALSQSSIKLGTNQL